MTAQVIADQLEVSKRTVYRDVASLQAMSVPVEGEAGIGYVMRAGFDLPPLMLTAEEVEALEVDLAKLTAQVDTLEGALAQRKFDRGPDPRLQHD